ncbi:cutinase family protein [Nocardia sp. CDC160]|uniref:cutinase family protein n=1 Tax=Nocardia sp. CDC160 TaxID=3112166 RepID=UPI002DB850D7|nr:cutinase family protein [Nocardia sp. CDC160]MEC3918379.1 cutinase family protein [Nocardia sp. CDC160]
MRRLVRSGAATVAAAAVAFGTVVVGDARGEVGGRPTCTPYTAILAPGTWETRMDADPTVPVGMLRPIGDGLQRQFGRDITVLYAPYAASAFDQGLSYAESLTSLEDELRSMLGKLCDSTRVLLAGYSQGANGVGDLATEIGNGAGPIAADRVLGVGLVADPHRDPDASLALGDPQPGHGIAGTRSRNFGALTDRVRTLCVQGDLYCSLDAGTSPFLAALGRVLSGDTTPIANLIPAAIQPEMLLDQAIVVGSGWAATAANLPTILNGLTKLPDAITTGDLLGAHRIATEVNAALTPIVQAAEGVDLTVVGAVIRAAAAIDPTGWTAAASLIADTLTRVNILRIAGDVAQMQDILWQAVESLTRNDVLGAAAQVAALGPAGLDVANAVAGPLASAIHGDLLGAAQTLLSLSGPDSISSLVQLGRQGVDMATFYASNAHVDYADDVQILLGFLGSQIQG